MARPKGRPKTSTRVDKTIRVDARIAGMIEILARAEGISAAELASETLRAPIERKYAAMMEKFKGSTEK